MFNSLPTPPDPPEKGFFYGNQEHDLTNWLCEWVRVELAEHHSTIYETVPRGSIPIIVQLVLGGMAAAESEGGEEDAEGTGEETPKGG